MSTASSSNIESHLKESRVFKPSKEFAAKAHIRSMAQYKKLWTESVKNPERFWKKQAETELVWMKPFKKVLQWKVPFAKWFVGGQLNVSSNCLDKWLGTATANKAALIWEGEPATDGAPGEERVLTYRQLHREVCRFANVLKRNGVGKGDRVIIYLPMIPEAAIAMLACTRIGAVHSVVFGGFSAQSVADRIQDCGAKLVITSDGGFRRGAVVPLKKNVDDALVIRDAAGKSLTETIEKVIVVRRCGNEVQMTEERDVWWHRELQYVSDECPAAKMDSEAPLFILYTSGSTGKPKGILHTTAGYLLGTKLTSKYVFDLKDEDVYWCTADVGWVTGHSYIVYGPLANGATTLIFEGVPSYPSCSRFWQVIDKHKVNIFYTAPTALRALMREGPEPLKETSRASVRLLGTVGEPINPEAWEWYFHSVGQERCPIIDTWWQTETGGIMLSPLVSAQRIKPGCATQPMFGVQPVLLDEQGKEIKGAGSGVLAIKSSWPAQIRSVYGDPQRMVDTYFKPYPGYYFTGDGARRDEDGDYWITGRIDDVINVSGHRIGTAEVESALVLHDSVAEAAVVGYPHDVKGQGIYAFVTAMNGVETHDELKKELLALVSKEIGSFAKPDLIQWAPALPKTRSGKIMRRILRKIACNELDSLGDTSTLADPSVVQGLIDKRLNP